MINNVLLFHSCIDECNGQCINNRSAKIDEVNVYDRRLISGYEHRCTINESTYDLTIHKTRLNDTGEYWCIENGGFGAKHVTELYVTVTQKFYENVTDVIIGQSVTLPCTASPGSTAVWHYERYCENLDHSMYLCSLISKVATDTRNRYRIRRNAHGENNLLINDVTKNMTGLYMCKDDDSDVILYKVLLNVITASTQSAFIGHPVRLFCGAMENTSVDWHYQESKNARRRNITVNGTLRKRYNVTYTTDGYSLIISEVRASDAGIYLCGRGRKLYHKLQLIVSARPLRSTALSGYPVILTCSQNPAAPVSWTFQHSSHSEAQNIVISGSVGSDYAERFEVLDTSLIIYKIQLSDDGSYNCCDANGDVFTYNVTVFVEPEKMPNFCSTDCDGQVAVAVLLSVIIVGILVPAYCFLRHYLRNKRKAQQQQQAQFEDQRMNFK